mgnify:CR=1 FL=1
MCVGVASDLMSGIDELLRVLVITFIIFSLISVAIYWIIISITIKPLLLLGKNINSIASGNADLTQRIDQTRNDEIGSVVSGFNGFTGKLQEIISGIKKSNQNLHGVGEVLIQTTQENASAINQILGSIDDVSALIRKQTDSVGSTANAVNEISSNIESLNNMISGQASSVEEASAAVEEMIGNISSVNQSVEKMAASFEELRKSKDPTYKLYYEIDRQVYAQNNQGKVNIIKK